MTFKYRHISYDSDCSGVDCIEGDVGGRYRGQQWHVRYPRHLSVPQPQPTLRYRGVAYNMSRPSDQINLAVSMTAAKTQEKTASVIPREKPPEDEWKQVHKANVCRLLDRRRQQAQAEGNQQLLKSLDLEAQQWVC
ncbi:MAG: DUF4278 domain-containing protein [Microcoleaceae cyanobacterium]